MKFDNQLRYAASVVSTYRGEMPLAAWLKNYFRENKQMGSRDRRQLSNLVYGFYRLGHAVKGLAVEERLLLGLYLCQEVGEMLAYFRPDWVEGSLDEKMARVRAAGIDFVVEEIFPWKEELSDGIDHRTYCLSFLRQPDLFLRIRPGHEKKVLEKAAGLHADFIAPSTLRMPNGIKVEEYFMPDRDVVIQDYSSQRTGDFLPVARPGRFWDACAASGGKAIMVADRYPGVEMTVSDVRESILVNLRGRFRTAGVVQYTSFVADLQAGPPEGTAPVKATGGAGGKGFGRFDLVLADVPCTGSGTWSRTPEELYFFDVNKIGAYSGRQRAIIGNVVPSLDAGATLLYCTCSVFRRENEEMVDLLGGQWGLVPEKAGLIGGMAERADTMYAARMRRV